DINRLIAKKPFGMDLESSHEFAKYWLLYECPISLSSEDVRDEKVCVLRCIPPTIRLYPGSNCPTYAAAINNEYWEAEIRVQLQHVPGNVFKNAPLLWRHIT
ncbi:8362_t:CDS:2, partial [Gigaspora rosea]